MLRSWLVNGRFVDQIDIETGGVIKRYPSISAAQKEIGTNNIAAVCSDAVILNE